MAKNPRSFASLAGELSLLCLPSCLPPRHEDQLVASGRCKPVDRFCRPMLLAQTGHAGYGHLPASRPVVDLGISSNQLSKPSQRPLPSPPAAVCVVRVVAPYLLLSGPGKLVSANNFRAWRRCHRCLLFLSVREADGVGDIPVSVVTLPGGDVSPVVASGALRFGLLLLRSPHF